MSLRRLLFEGDVLRLMSFTFLTKPLGLITQVLLATYFGAGVQLDAFTFARFPVVMLAQSSKRIFSSVAIPLLMKSRSSMSEQEVHAYQLAMVLLFYTPVTILLGLLFIFNEAFIGLIGNQLPPETKAYAADFLRYLSIPGILFSMVGMSQTLLNLNDIYKVPGFIPVLNSSISLLAIIFLHKPLGIWSLAVGFAASHAVGLPVVTINALRSGALRFVKPRIPAGGARLLFLLSWMVFAEQAILMVNTFADKWFAAGLEEGSISSINYSSTLLNLGLQAFNLSLVVVMFTRLSRLHSQDDMAGFNMYFRDNLRKVCNLVVPASLGIFLANEEVVRVLFQRGSFDAADTARTAGALGMYMLGLPALIINGIVTKIFQSLQRLKEKIYLALQYIVTNIVGNIILVKSLAITGLAISSSVAINLHLFLSIGVLYGFRSGVAVGPMFSTIMRSYVIALLVWLTYQLGEAGAWITNLLPGNGLLSQMASGCLKFFFAVAGYTAGMLLWKSVRRSWARWPRHRK